MHRLLQMDRVFRDLDIPLQPVQYRELEKRIQKNALTVSFSINHLKSILIESIIEYTKRARERKNI